MIVGILLTLLVGLIWTGSGIFASCIARRTNFIITISLLTNLIALIGTVCLMRNPLEFLSGESHLPGLGFLLLIIFGGIFNNLGVTTLQFAMKHGNSSRAWAIGQSALIVPAISMCLIFKDPLQYKSILGIAAILTGMIVLANAQRNNKTQAGTHSLKLSLLAFVLIGSAQSLQTATSYSSYSDIHGIRPPIMQIAICLTLLVLRWLSSERNFKLTREITGLILGTATCAFVSSRIIFSAMDILQPFKLTGMVYPLAVGTCIFGFKLYTMLIRKEERDPNSIMGTACILLGIIFFCSL